MAEKSQIKYLTNKEIDWKRWDACIRGASNGLIYAYSIYLSQMAKHCDALVLNDYDAVMPLTWNKKFGFSYLYQPPFTASLGVFGKNINEETVKRFLDAIPVKFRLIEISLNHENNFPSEISGYYARSNNILDLNQPYETLLKEYRENHKRNIAKSIHLGCKMNKEFTVDDVIQLNQQYFKHTGNTTQEDHSNFVRLYDLLRKSDSQNIDERLNATVYGITGPDNKLLASAVFFFSHNRAYYILVGNHPDGKTFGASHALVDAFIKDHAGRDLILDFEGSDIRNLAFFYSGFGAKEEIYPAIKINRLPWYVRLVKK
jgi:hypothetical protein